MNPISPTIAYGSKHDASLTHEAFAASGEQRHGAVDSHVLAEAVEGSAESGALILMLGAVVAQELDEPLGLHQLSPRRIDNQRHHRRTVDVPPPQGVSNFRQQLVSDGFANFNSEYSFVKMHFYNNACFISHHGLFCFAGRGPFCPN